MSPFEISPQQLKELLDSPTQPHLVDCREPFEYQMARLESSELIPMNTIPSHLSHLESLAEARLLVVYCHHGVRSLNTVAWLRQQGIENVVSLGGGIDRWSLEVDPAVPRY